MLSVPLSLMTSSEYEGDLYPFCKRYQILLSKDRCPGAGLAQGFTAMLIVIDGELSGIDVMDTELRSGQLYTKSDDEKDDSRIFAIVRSAIGCGCCIEGCLSSGPWEWIASVAGVDLLGKLVQSVRLYNLE